MVGRRSLVNSRVDKIANGVIVSAANEKLEGRVLVGVVDDLLDLLERVLVNDGAHESTCLLIGASDGDLGNSLLETGEELLGTGFGKVETRSSGALLALVLKGTSDGVVHSVLNIGGLVNKVEVLAASLADQSGEVSVLLVRNPLTDLAVQGAEDVGGADEVKTSKLTVGKDNIGNLLGVTRNKLDNVLRKTSFKEDLVDQSAGVDVVLRRLPENNVTHQSRAGDEVTTDSGKVEWGDSVNKTLERAVLQSTVGLLVVMPRK